MEAEISVNWCHNGDIRQGVDADGVITIYFTMS